MLPKYRPLPTPPDSCLFAEQDQNNLYEKLKTKEDAINDMENG